jgi:glutamate formiminotransferase/glutamate formiminotransferase/formiminotetrahydrofolate cyclodeaminase
MVVLESVPNVSEGREPSVVAAIAAAFASAGGRVLDTHVDADHHRAVVTLVADERALEEGLVAGVDEARRWIDLRRHVGVHPRVGAADVVPVVPLVPGEVGTAVAVAGAVARRVGEELGLPVFLYGVLADGRRPAFYRRGGPDALQARIDAGELEPAHGPARLDPSAGAVLVGVRAPLLAFNLELRGSFDAAAAVAASVRESSGGLPGVQALALEVGPGVQLSTNVIDLDATPPHVLVEHVVAEAARRGLRVGHGELVGLIPAASVARAAADAGVAEPLDASGVPTPGALAAAARALRLDGLEPDRVLEWHLR